MTPGAYDAPVRRYLQLPLWFVLGAVVATAFGIANDLRRESRDRVATANRLQLPATVADEGRVRYVNPRTDQELTVEPAWYGRDVPSEPGTDVAIEVDPANPEVVRLKGEFFRASNSYWEYVPIVAIPLLWWLARRRGFSNVRRLAASDEPTFSMLGAISPPRWLRHRCELNLYPIGAPPGAKAVCTIPVITTRGWPMGATFPVEVKGKPRPFGRVAVLADDEIFWLAGRSLRSSLVPRPTNSTSAPLKFRSAASPLLLGTRAQLRSIDEVKSVVLHGFALASVALLFVVTIITLMHAAEARQLQRDGLAVIALIVDHGRDTVTIEYRTPGGRTLRARSPASDPEDYPVGHRFPARADTEPPQRVRLDAEGFNSLTPIIGASVPLLVSGFLVARHWRRRLRARRAARRGPWYEADLWWADVSALLAAVGDGPSRLALASVPVSVHRLEPPTTSGSHRFLVAGDVTPSGTVAIWQSPRSSSRRPTLLVATCRPLPRSAR